jgi:hypothetical protein
MTHAAPRRIALIVGAVAREALDPQDANRTDP